MTKISLWKNPSCLMVTESERPPWWAASDRQDCESRKLRAHTLNHKREPKTKLNKGDTTDSQTKHGEQWPPPTSSKTEAILAGYAAC